MKTKTVATSLHTAHLCDELALGVLVLPAVQDDMHLGIGPSLNEVDYNAMIGELTACGWQLGLCADGLPVDVSLPFGAGWLLWPTVDDVAA